MWNWIKKLSDLEDSHQDFALITTIQIGGSTPREIGSKMIVLPDGNFFGTIGGGNLEKQVIESAKRCLEEGQSSTLSFSLGAKTGQCCGGVVEVFIDSVITSPRVYIFGAGHVGQALANTLRGTPFNVHLIDQRNEWIDHESLFSEIKKDKRCPKEVIQSINWHGGKSFVLLMTHSHQLDYDLLGLLLKKPLSYLGLIGSQTKWLRFSKRLEEDDFTKQELEKVTCPIGLPFGGKSPQEIAISVSAQLLKLHHNQESP
ncbi:MAG: xanthine dehydrogenase accessory protein XdhC [Bdellovibrionota bacterium]|nr:xanthine dehydrogenase accessory protein XdhC [Bdellovibrionota bacterium]